MARGRFVVTFEVEGDEYEVRDIARKAWESFEQAEDIVAVDYEVRDVETD